MLDLASLAEWTAEAAYHLSGPDQAAWLERIDERLAEITFAIHPGMRGGDGLVEASLRIAINLGRYWWMRGHASWARSALKDLAIASDRLTPLHADGLLALAGLDYAESRYEDVKRSCTQASAIYHSLANDAGVAAALNHLGIAEREGGELTAARGHHEEARALYLALGDERGAVSCLSNLGVVALFEGNLDVAETLHAGALAERHRLGVCETLDARALLTFAEDLPAEAVRLFAVAQRAREASGAPLPPVYRKEADRVLEKCKARIGGKAFDAAWKAGLSPQYSPFPLTPAGVP